MSGDRPGGAPIEPARSGPAATGDLTPREREILILIVEGLSNPEIARRLIVGRSTVKYHVSSSLAKLGVANRTEAVMRAIQGHLVD